MGDRELGAGRARAGRRVHRARRAAAVRGAASLQPGASRIRREPAAGGALDESGASVVASFILAGGVLSGKYDVSACGPDAELLDDPDLEPELASPPALRALAAELETTPAALAIAFALANERVSSVPFGATAPGAGSREHRSRGHRRPIDRHAVGRFMRARRLSQATFPRWTDVFSTLTRRSCTADGAL